LFGVIGARSKGLVKEHSVTLLIPESGVRFCDGELPVHPERVAIDDAAQAFLSFAPTIETLRAV
jgi:hypothetical protein